MVGPETRIVWSTYENIHHKVDANYNACQGQNQVKVRYVPSNGDGGLGNSLLLWLLVAGIES